MEKRIRPLRREDLPALTAMWNDTDPIWPGGLSSGMPLTLDRTAHWVDSTGYLTPFVAVRDGRVVGFCGLTPDQGEPDVAYISILGVHPDVLSQGFGRDLLRAAIARAASLGYRRLDLDTWTANTRAIPLYKRCGFFWVPGTSVKMQNFLPSLLHHEQVRRLLGETDWYVSYRPNITLAEDTYYEGNLPALPYRFERDGRSISLMVEVGSGELLAYQDEEVRVGVEVSQPKLIVGEPALARVVVERRGGALAAIPMAVFVEGRGGVRAERAVSEQVTRGASLEFPLLATRPHREAFAVGQAVLPGFSARVALGDLALSMGATLPTTPALEVVAEPRQVSLAPGQPARFWLGIRNHRSETTSARLQLTSCGDFDIRPMQDPAFALAGGETASVQVELLAPEGLHTLRAVPIRVEPEGTTLVEAGMLEVPVVAGGPSQAYAYRTEDGAIVENAYLRAVVSAKGGTYLLQTKNPTQDLVEQRANLGPPFFPSEFFYRNFDVQVDAREGTASVHLAVESVRNPGLWFRRSITVTASPRVETEFSLVNASDRPYTVAVRAEHTMRLHSSLVAVPLSEGLLVDSAEAADWEGGARFPQCYAETWASLQREDLTVGFLWPEGSSPEFSRRYGPVFTLPQVTVEPGQTLESGRVVVYAGAGGWRTVRDQWRRLFKPDAPEQPEEPVRAAQAELRPGSVAWSGEPVKLDLRIHHLRGRALSGRARLELPPGWSASESEWKIEGLRRGQPLTFQTVVQPSGDARAGAFPAADQGRLILDANLALGMQPVALLALGAPGGTVAFDEVPASGRRVIRVDNGWASFGVCPEYAASVVDFTYGGKNHLLTSFPAPGELMWQRPFFGGIGPALAPGGEHFHPIHAGRLHEETFAVEYPVEREQWGARWRGVRLAANLQLMAGIRLTVDYLTLPGSNLLLVVVGFLNKARAPQQVQSFLGCYLRVGGEIERTVLRYQAEGEHNTRRAAYDVWLAPSGDWAAVEAEPSGLTAALVSGTRWAYIQSYSLGLDGAHLFNVGDTLLAPGGSASYATLFVLAEGPEKARLYRALGWSGKIGLPPEH